MTVSLRDRPCPSANVAGASMQLVELLDLVAVQRLVPSAELEAVVLGRIVRAGDLDAADDVEVVQAPVEQRRRDDADVDDVDARRS